MRCDWNEMQMQNDFLRHRFGFYIESRKRIFSQSFFFQPSVFIPHQRLEKREEKKVNKKFEWKWNFCGMSRRKKKSFLSFLLFLDSKVQIERNACTNISADCINRYTSTARQIECSKSKREQTDELTLTQFCEWNLKSALQEADNDTINYNASTVAYLWRPL